MILNWDVWDKVTHQFNEDEKEEICINLDGEVICPRGWSLDLNNLNFKLRIKLLSAIDDVKSEKPH